MKDIEMIMLTSAEDEHDGLLQYSIEMNFFLLETHTLINGCE